MKQESYIHEFESDITAIAHPKKFTNPFHYTPHSLVELASKQLQEYLDTNSSFKSIFRNGNNDFSEGKMFGVLIVKDQDDELGFIMAFSGSLSGFNQIKGFVPPVFDLLQKDNYFKKGEAEIDQINYQIEQLQNQPKYQKAKSLLAQGLTYQKQHIQILKDHIKVEKQKREGIRKNLNPTENSKHIEKLNRTSALEKIELNRIKKNWLNRIHRLNEFIAIHEGNINKLKEKRKRESALLQNKIFNDFKFLNAQKETKSLLSIFSEHIGKHPPAGAGECAAPKLLQYAFQHDLTPIAMGEFWYGAAPATTIRKHKQFYPACKGKCEPILKHMLKGLDIEVESIQKSPIKPKELEVLFEDEYLLIINKPEGILSVPGKTKEDSILTRVKTLYPEITGPGLVHRLDMATSGILIAAKQKEVHKHLQEQFASRSVFKRYEALLDGVINEQAGEIHLPLRVDLDDRPKQLVCFEHGKNAITRWEKVREIKGKTLVNLYPHTGRTHQLRVHCAHKAGLNIPIVGDNLYGTPENRMYLHAAAIQFQHPITNELIKVNSPSGFGRVLNMV